LHYITREEAIGKNFQPINSNWGILPELGFRVKVKKERAGHHKARAIKAMKAFLPEWTQPFASKSATLPTTASVVLDAL
jgi:methylenetetrahydrofolate--tRNA-(uracil-5-)-methyltransferase